MLHKTYVGNQIIFLNSVDSTNNYVANLYKTEGIESGTVIMADFQTKGRGQRGKVWQSDSSANLIMSIGAKLTDWEIDSVISLNHIVSLSLHGLFSNYQDDVKIKWPNDIMVQGKKISGILIENYLSSNSIFSIIGIGANINQTQFDIERATSLFIETNSIFQPRDIAMELIRYMNEILNLYNQRGDEYIKDMYNALLWKKDEKHMFYIGEEVKEGRIFTTDADGLLGVYFENEERWFHNGEVKY
ncbi:MAG: biotin--[acetyl-CoA-carboxylase] ligase [Brumimicrobium sp.]|nr:biotin--[acetyl-CoA-carboxylase] ligase [Brumimicrobium sp.]MCO5268351.1 biotin--[acetyl-CoA-carboxylase] ligase [Brumimicrobium sp.]